MEESLAGRLVVASPLLIDPNFVRSVVLLLEHDENGALGIVLDRPSTEPLAAHLPDLAQRASPPEVVFVGGPVSPEVAVGLERCGDPSRSISLDGVALVDFTHDDGDGGEVRVYAGYAGWGPGQLEDELEEGAWAVVDADPDDPFTSLPSDLWRVVLRRAGGRMALLSTYPPDPDLN